MLPHRHRGALYPPHTSTRGRRQQPPYHAGAGAGAAGAAASGNGAAASGAGATASGAGAAGAGDGAGDGAGAEGAGDGAGAAAGASFCGSGGRLENMPMMTPPMLPITSIAAGAGAGARLFARKLAAAPWISAAAASCSFLMSLVDLAFMKLAAAAWISAAAASLSASAPA